jgi:hypothetical protein
VGELESWASEFVNDPAKVLRVQAMLEELRQELRTQNLDDACRARLGRIQDHAVDELTSTLSPALANELLRVVGPFDTQSSSNTELLLAEAQLLGWLDGLLRGLELVLVIQETKSVQDLAAKAVAPITTNHAVRPPWTN